MSSSGGRGAVPGGETAAPVLDFRCPLPSGLHARPASHLSEAASAFACSIELVGARGQAADAKSVIALVALDVRHDEPCRLRFEGADAVPARAALERFVREVLPGCDAPLGTASGPAERELVLPRALSEAQVRPLRGRAVVGGIGRGVVVLARASLPDAAQLDAGGSPEQELERARRALAELHAALSAELAAAPPGTAGILRAHLALARDAALEQALGRHVAGGRAAPRAAVLAGQELGALLARSESALVRERAVDVEDLCLQLVERLCGVAGPGAIVLEGPSVLLAERLAPRQLLALERRHLQGLLLASAGATSHAVILARSFGIPTLTDAAEARGALFAGARVVVDAELGIALVEDDPRVRRHYDRRLAARERRRVRLAAWAEPPATTCDGRRVEVAANVASVEELEPAFAAGAEGIGLLRTEMLFLDRAQAPTEEEQLAFLTRVLEAAAGRPVIVRALDVGGDKPLPYLGLPAESNPFLGRRGVRLYPELGALVDGQLRAVLRAAARGPLRLMLPMVSRAEEVVAVRERLARLREELAAGGTPCADELSVGIMLEVPSAAFDLERLAEVADFFSLGTNDLAQYFFAADRENERVADLHDPLQPPFLRFLRSIVSELRGRGRWIGLCGELARDPTALPLLIGLGLDEVSLATPELTAAKRQIAGLDAALCAALLDEACACADAPAVRALLSRFRSTSGAQPLCTPELIALDCGARSRSEAIEELAGLLHAAFRSDDPLAVERAVWEREETYSTGLGGGFAVPHCKTDAVSGTTLAVVRLARPVDWDALDGEPVRCALLLAVRASEDQREHMRTFSKLARRLVDETFRAELLAAPDAASMLSSLTRELELDTPAS